MRKGITAKQRILENIYDVICNTQFKKKAEKELKKQLGNKNITYNYNVIEIENEAGDRIQYTITMT